jgi:hypothetical protein
MTFRPTTTPLHYLPALLALLLAGLAFWLWGLLGARVFSTANVEERIFNMEVFLLGLALALTLAAIGMLSYLAWCIFSMRYHLDERQLQIWVGGVWHAVPIASINAVYAPGEEVEGEPLEVVWKRTNPPLPGYVVGAGVSTQFGNVVAVATQPAGRQVIVATLGLAFALSPANEDRFVKGLRARLRPSTEDHDELDTEEAITALMRARPRTDLHGISSWGAPLWADGVSRALFLGGLALCVLLFAYLATVYSGLPENLPIHWDAQGQPDFIGGPIELLRLPAFALGIWLANAIAARLVLTRERAATLLLLAGGFAVQIIFAAAAMSIVLRA